jgi:hypothetical protein
MLLRRPRLTPEATANNSQRIELFLTPRGAPNCDCLKKGRGRVDVWPPVAEFEAHTLL